MSPSINYLAVLVGGAASMVLGFVWYGPLFGKAWMKLVGITPEQVAKAKEKGMQSMMKSYVANFVAALVLNVVLAHFLAYAGVYTGMSGVSAGLSAGFQAWLGFIATVTVGLVLWEGKPWKYWFITNGYQLVNLLIVGIILSVWM